MSRQPQGPRRLADLSGTSPERLSGISDGIFSVGMTLLVLGLVVPALNGSSTTEGELWHGLKNLGPSVLVYTMSFMTLGIFWLGQGTQLGRLARSNRNYVWIHLLFLFAVTMVPFSTLLLARFYWLKPALLEYWLNIVLLGAMLLASLEYGLRANLFREEGRAGMAHLMRGRILIAQSLYAVATALCVIFPTWVSIGLIVLIQLNYVLAPRIPILHRF
ncbi:MAG TPA: TMEM175 family protein [Candidatus Dormibacteraeota bacterium]